MPKQFVYIDEANVTASNNFHGDKVPLHYFQGVINNAIEVIKQLDGIKKTIFYGRDLPVSLHDAASLPNCQGLPKALAVDDEQRAELLIHSIIGKATECGELLEMLQHVLFQGGVFDDVNFIEEIGDGQWYDAIGLRAIGATFEETQRGNIAKLRLRFPNKFTEFDANNRDLFAERKILEGAGEHDLDTPAGMSAANDVTGEALPIINKPWARLNNWLQMGNVLIGDVVGHPTLGDAIGVRTSFVLNMDEAKGVCETKNTLYRLGEPYKAVPRSISGLSPEVDTQG